MTMNDFTQLAPKTFVSNETFMIGGVNFKMVLEYYVYEERKVDVTYSILLVVEYSQLHQEHKTLTEEQYYQDRLFELASFLVKKKRKVYSAQKEVQVEEVFNSMLDSMLENLPCLELKVSSSKAKKTINYLLTNED